MTGSSVSYVMYNTFMCTRCCKLYIRFSHKQDLVRWKIQQTVWKAALGSISVSFSLLKTHFYNMAF